jgi:hypothetical protein
MQLLFQRADLFDEITNRTCESTPQAPRTARTEYGNALLCAF